MANLIKKELDEEVHNITLELDNAQYYGATPDLIARNISLIHKLHNNVKII